MRAIDCLLGTAPQRPQGGDAMYRWIPLSIVGAAKLSFDGFRGFLTTLVFFLCIR
jgi:hypothetical protein